MWSIFPLIQCLFTKNSTETKSHHGHWLDVSEAEARKSWRRFHLPKYQEGNVIRYEVVLMLTASNCWFCSAASKLTKAAGVVQVKLSKYASQLVIVPPNSLVVRLFCSAPYDCYVLICLHDNDAVSDLNRPNNAGLKTSTLFFCLHGQTDFSSKQRNIIVVICY